MKITAVFDSIDTADVVAAALRHRIPGMVDIGVSPPELDYHGGYTNIQAFSPQFSGGVGSPVMSTTFITNDTNQPDTLSKSCSLSLVCRKEDAALAKRIMIGYGGRDLKGT
ncbi:MAG: hypothetical protein LBM87_03235 [Ruminococcus sp.]|jgi:hypothetical protein|nr:hypothetical protein [Ruminococcus sp.]